MFIEQSKSDEVPKGAIRLTRDEVFDYMIDLIKKWPNSMEMLVERYFNLCYQQNTHNTSYLKTPFFFRWALKHGNPILSSAVVLSNTLMLSYYRQRLKLRNYGRFTLFLPVVLIPSIFSLSFQNSVSILQTLMRIFINCNLMIYSLLLNQ